MKNKKGFTLVELLGVIVIMALLVAVAVPSTFSISNRLKEKMFCSKIDSIETAAQLYGEDHRDSFVDWFVQGEEQFKSKTLEVKTLVESGYLRKDQNEEPFIVDPRNKKSSDLYHMSFTIYVKYNRVYVSFNEEVKTTCGK